MSEAGRVWTTVGADIAPLEAGYAKADALTRGFAAKLNAQTRAMQSLGRTWNRYITLPVIAAGAASVKFGMDFQRQMTLVQTSAGASARDVKVLSGEILKLAQSGKTPFDPSELAKAMYHLKSLGGQFRDNAVAMNTLKVAVNGAIAGNASLEETTSALGAAMRTLHLSGKDATHTMATLNAIVGAGNMRMDELISALGTGVLPAARTTGISLRDVGAALATMTDEGMSADSAATRLRMTFALMSAPTHAAQKALAAIGLGANDLSMTMRTQGLIPALEQLKQHLDGLAGSSKLREWAQQVDRGKMSLNEFIAAAAKTQEGDVLVRAFGGGRSSAAIMLLLNNLDVMNQKYHQIASTTKNFNRDVIAGQANDLVKLKENWSAIKASLIEAAPVITGAVVRITGAVAKLTGWFSSLGSGTKKWLEIGAGALALGGPLLLFTAKMIRAVETIAGLFTVEAASATRATGVITADMAAQDAAMAGTVGKVGILRGALLGLSRLSIVIPIAIAIHEIISRTGSWVDKNIPGAGAISSFVNNHLGGNWVNQHLGFGGGGGGNSQTGLTAGQSVGATGGGLGVHGALHANRARQNAARAKAAAAAQRAHEQAINQLLGASDPKGPPVPSGLGGSGGGSGGSNGPKLKKTRITNPVVALAAKYLGVPYVWGGNTPSGWDCSGFVQWVFKQMGIQLPHYTGDQIKLGQKVSLGNIKPGDVVFTEPGKGGVPGHEGLYIGGGKVEEAPHTGDKTKIISLSSFLSGGLVGIRRFGNFGGSTNGIGGYGTAGGPSLTGAASPVSMAAVRAMYATMLKEIAGLDGTTRAKVQAAMRGIGKEIQHVVTPADLAMVKFQLGKVGKIISAAVTQMKADIQAKKTALSNAFTRLTDAAFSAFDKATQKHLSEIQAQYGAPTPSEAALAALEDAHNQQQLQQNLADAMKSGDPQAIADAQYAIQVDTLQKQADAERKAADEQSQIAQDAYQTQRDLQRQAMQDQIDAIQQKMAQGKESAKQGAADIAAVFTKYGVDMGDTAVTMAGVIYNTLADGMNALIGIANDLDAALRKLGVLQGHPSGGGRGGRSSGGASRPGTSQGGFTVVSASNGRGAAGAVRSIGLGSAVHAMAAGGSGWVTKPTLFLSGEAGPEFASFTPARGGGGPGAQTVVVEPGAIVVEMDGQKVGRNTRRQLLRTQRRNGSPVLG